MSKIITRYLKKVEQTYRSGVATEHSYRSYLKDLLESLGEVITAINEPKRIKCGAPDYIVKKGETTFGYIEAKDIGIYLKNEEKTCISHPGRSWEFGDGSWGKRERHGFPLSRE